MSDISSDGRASVPAIFRGLLDLIYPPKCVVCNALGESYLCSRCVASIDPVPLPYCKRCGHTMTGLRCHLCWGRSKSFTTARAAGDYSGVIRQAIHQFKYGGARMLAEPLASILYDYLTNSADFPWRRAQCIVPVPIHPERLRVRGYNQSELLAGELSKLVELPLVADAVFRSVRTRPQVELSGDERRSNVKSAFQVTKPEAITGKIVLLVDDVATTCSTVHECSLTIKNVGASKVYVLCLAFGA